MRRAQLGELSASPLSVIAVADCLGEQLDDLLVAPEVDEVLERQVDRTEYRADGAQLAQLGELSFTAGHVTTILPRADAPLYSD